MLWTKLGLNKQRLRKLQLHREKLKKLHLTKRHYLIAGGAILLLAALLAGGANAMWGSDAVTVPQHTRIHVVLDQAVATSTRPGHHFRATVSRPVVIKGKTVIPKDARAEGVVVEAKPAGRFKGRPRLLLALQSVDVNSEHYAVHTLAARELGRSHKKHNLRRADALLAPSPPRGKQVATSSSPTKPGRVSLGAVAPSAPAFSPVDSFAKSYLLPRCANSC